MIHEGSENRQASDDYGVRLSDLSERDLLHRIDDDGEQAARE